MSNALSPELLNQLFAQESADPFLMLVTLSHPTLTEPLLFVNNSVDIVSRGKTYSAFPVTINLPTDDGETAREVSMNFDNVSREIIGALRSITDPMTVKVEMVLASDPNSIQITLDDLKSKSINYTAITVNMRLYMDSFLSTAMTSEKYSPTNFPGLF